MKAAKFPEANCVFLRPPDLDSSQCFDIPAFCGEQNKGTLDGSVFVVVVWMPTEKELQQLNSGSAVYLTMLGGLAPHFITTSFSEAISF